MNYVVIYKNKFGISGFRYMHGKDVSEVESLFTINYPEFDILGTYVSVTDACSALLSLCKML